MLGYSHLPPALERNPLFRKLFALRKVYLSKTKFRHYSQFGEDIMIHTYFPKGHRGFFVDVGCYHPVKFNNTFELYRRGWRGINVDIEPVKIDAFDVRRRGDTNVCCAVSDVEGEVEYWSSGYYSLSSTLMEQPYETDDRVTFERRRVRARRLDDLIADSPFHDRPLDLLCIDAEGHELAVLRGLDFTRHRPKLIVIEIVEPDVDHLLASPSHAHVRDAGYAMVNWMGTSVFYLRQDAAD
ncbi:MAG: FkbM family methyltransferase [Planctomycetes bacterium]|nr:FkbM family methyltransferase [Planctomycetota bacterium]